MYNALTDPQTIQSGVDAALENLDNAIDRGDRLTVSQIAVSLRDWVDAGKPLPICRTLDERRRFTRRMWTRYFRDLFYAVTDR